MKLDAGEGRLFKKRGKRETEETERQVLKELLSLFYEFYLHWGVIPVNDFLIKRKFRICIVYMNFTGFWFDWEVLVLFSRRGCGF